MVTIALQLAIEVILISQGLGQYTTIGALTGITGEKKTPYTLTEEQLEEIKRRGDIERERQLINQYGRDQAAESRRRIEDSKNALKNRKVAIAALPTSADLRLADAARRSKSNIVVPTSGPSKDELAETRARLQKLNDESIVRTLAQENKLRETMENMEEQRARDRARQEQSQGQLSLLAQRQARVSADIAKIQQMSQQKRDTIQTAQAVTAEANAAVIRAEEEQRAKALSQQVPRRTRLPPSVKLGGSKPNLLNRIMDETGMNKEEAMRYIEFYGF